MIYQADKYVDDMILRTYRLNHQFAKGILESKLVCTLFDLALWHGSAHRSWS